MCGNPTTFSTSISIHKLAKYDRVIHLLQILCFNSIKVKIQCEIYVPVISTLKKSNDFLKNSIWEK
jgi:hypothetical protein